MRILSTLSQAATISLVLCGPVLAFQDQIVEQDRYSNYDYAYAVRIPKGLTGSRAPSPFPNHGFVIQLSEHPNAKLAVDASYNAALWKSFDEAMEAHKEFFKHDVGGDVSVTAHAPTVLAKLNAMRFTMKAAGSSDVREVLLAFREADGEVGIVYEIVLTTSTSRYDQDKHLIDELQKTWRLKSLPK